MAEETEKKKADGKETGGEDDGGGEGDAAPAEGGGPGAAPPGGAPGESGAPPVAATPAGGGGGGGGAAGGPLTTFQEEKSGRLSKWDDEVAWADYFQTGAASGKQLQVDRGALIADALKDGAWAGFKSSAQSALIDTVLNTAFSRVPVVSGFLEMARIAYDPEAYLQGVLQGTAGKMAQGWDKVMSGDWITVIEGVLDIILGINGVIGTLSNICWIAASLGFVASLFCPAILPFVALAAQWGATLGTVSGLVALVGSLLQAGVASLRALEIAFSDASPDELLASGESLRTQTQSFSASYTARTAGALRGRAGAALQERGRANRTGKPAEDTATVDPPTRMQRVDQIVGIATGNFGGSGQVGQGVGKSYTSSRDSLTQAGAVTQAYRGTGDFAEGGVRHTNGQRTTMQRIADMQGAGANVFNDQIHRDKVQRRLTDDGEGEFTTRAQDHLDARAAMTSAQNRHTRNKDRVRRTRAKREQTQQELEEASSNLARVRAQHGDEVEALSQEVTQRRALASAFTQDRQAAEAGLRSAQESANMARSYNSAHPSKQYQDAADAADVEVVRWQQQVNQTRRWETEANQYASEGQAQLEVARAPIVAAEQRHTSAQTHSTLADRLYTNAQTDTRSSRSGVKTAQRELQPYHDVEDGRTLDAQESWNKSHLPFYKSDADDNLLLDESGNPQRSFWGQETLGQALQNSGPSSSYGVKRVNARLLYNTVTKGNDKHQKALEESGGADVAGGPMGVWASTMDDKALDWKGKSGRGEAGYAGQLQSLMDSMKDSLPPPPAGGAVILDGNKAAWDELEAEKQALGGLRSEAAAGQQAAAAEASAAEGVKALADSNKAAAQVQQEKAADKQAAQSELSAQASEAKGTFDESAGKAGEGGGLVGGMIGKFLQLMNIVPTRFIPGASGGTAGARRLQEGVSGSSEAAAGGQQAVSAVSTANAEFKSQTAQASTEASEVSGQMDGLGGTATQDAALARQGETELKGAEDQASADIASMEAEQARLAAEHDQWAVEMMNWSHNHHASRTAAMGELDGVVRLVDQQD